MSAWLMPTWGRPGAVSSIFTEMTGDRGTPPMPVNGFTGGGAAGVVLTAGVGVVGELLVGLADFFGLPPPPHAAVTSSAATASDAASTRTGRRSLMPALRWRRGAR